MEEELHIQLLMMKKVQLLNNILTFKHYPERVNFSSELKISTKIVEKLFLCKLKQQNNQFFVYIANPSP